MSAITWAQTTVNVMFLPVLNNEKHSMFLVNYNITCSIEFVREMCLKMVCRGCVGECVMDVNLCQNKSSHEEVITYAFY